MLDWTGLWQWRSLLFLHVAPPSSLSKAFSAGAARSPLVTLPQAGAATWSPSVLQEGLQATFTHKFVPRQLSASQEVQADLASGA